MAYFFSDFFAFLPADFFLGVVFLTLFRCAVRRAAFFEVFLRPAFLRARLRGAAAGSAWAMPSARWRTTVFNRAKPFLS